MSRVSSNESSFATDVLVQMGAPVTQSNLDFIERWIAREGGGGANNPLNTTQQMNGSTVLSGNTAGVQNYNDLDVGVQATVKTLRNGYYPNIVSALMAGNASEADSQGRLSSDLSTWSGGGYSTVSDVAIQPSNSIGSAGHPAGGPSTGLGRASQTDQNLTGDIDGFLKSQAPELAKALGDPEVQNLLQKWVANKLTDDEFRTQLEASGWWKNTPASQRQMLIDQATDPATAAQNITQAAHTLDTLAKQMGVGLPGGSEYQLVMDGMRNGWINTDGSVSDSSLAQQKLSTYYKQNSAQANTGAAATDADQLRQLYAEYALPVSPQKLSTQIQTVLSGTQSLNDLQAQIAQQAKTLYATNPQLVQAIEGGMTVKQWADPYLQHAANTLGLNPNSINLSAPMWQRVLNPWTDPKTGASTGQAMSLDQWDQTLRSDPTYGFDHSQNAINTASSFATQLVSKLTGAGV